VPEALEALYAAHAPAVFRIAWRLTGNRQDAEDVLQDVFIGLPEALHRYRETGHFAGWVKRVAARLALSRSRAVRSRAEADLPNDLAHPEGADDATARRLLLEETLAQLPRPLRAIVVLKKIEGFSHEEIAETLGITPGASRVKLARAMERLRKAMED